RDRLLPPLAEACYLRRDYAGARAALAQFSSRSPLPLLRPLLRYWTS
ncbi:lipopolysaccharide N-acetylglucosaminyl transferase, partial [Ralstonia pseudosolanacearum]